MKPTPLLVVIEDETIVLAGYQMLFESWGFRVVAAPSGQEALENARAAGSPPDFILADYRLRDGRTGTEAIAMLREEFGADIPAMLVTGDTAVDRLRNAAASGLPIIHKPVEGRALREILRKTLGPVC